jgi:chromosome segregation ATPase
MENYLTIKEFADFVGISTQAVYQRLDKDLKDYYEVIDGKKYLKKSVLSLFKENVHRVNANTSSSEYVEFLQAENEGLLTQVNEKDKALQVALKDKNILLQQINKLKLELENARQENKNLVLEQDSLKKALEVLKRDNETLKSEREQYQYQYQDDPQEVYAPIESPELEDDFNPPVEDSTPVYIYPDTPQEPPEPVVDHTAEILKEREETILQLQESLSRALQTTAELESQLSQEKASLTEKDSQIQNKEKRLDEKEDTIKQLLSQLQTAQEHSQYMSTQLARANESLSEATFKAQELTQNQQILMKQQQDNQILLANNSQPKGLLERIFGKK